MISENRRLGPHARLARSGSPPTHHGGDDRAPHVGARHPYTPTLRRSSSIGTRRPQAGQVSRRVGGASSRPARRPGPSAGTWGTRWARAAPPVGKPPAQAAHHAGPSGRVPMEIHLSGTCRQQAGQVSGRIGSSGRASLGHPVLEADQPPGHRCHRVLLVVISTGSVSGTGHTGSTRISASIAPSSTSWSLSPSVPTSAKRSLISAHRSRCAGVSRQTSRSTTSRQGGTDPSSRPRRRRAVLMP